MFSLPMVEHTRRWTTWRVGRLEFA